MPLTVTSNVKQLSDGSTAGTVMGQATNAAGLPDNISFFGATPAPQLLQGTLWGQYGALNVNVVSASPTSVLANSTSEKSFTLVGVASTDVVVAAIKPTTQAGLLMGTSRVSAANTIQMTMGNNTAGNLTPTTTESYQFVTVPTAMVTAVTLTPASVAANTTVEQFFTVTGIQSGQVVVVNKPTLNAGVMITQCRSAGANTVGITFANVTASTVTPTAGESYKFFAFQGMRAAPLAQNLAVALTPASVAANTTAEQTFTVAGLTLGTASSTPNVLVTKPSLQAGLTIAGARISALNTLAINFANDTASAITPTAAEVYSVVIFNTQIPAAGANINTAATLGLDAGAELTRMGWG